jgi:4-hydroxy-2-oxoheptanedioate aldolase
MIETQPAVENIDEILDVKGIAGIYVWPSDLAFSYGRPPTHDHEDPFFLAIYARLIEACNKRGLIPCLHIRNFSYASRAFAMGFRLVTILNDSGLLTMAAKAATDQVRRESGGLA